ncbi:hypothetical protein M501DRAFT_902017, partial [Patellaria atrata CBS 101060]
MVKFYESSYSYDYPFPAVTLAYFLRYPNPYSRHVQSTDVIERHFDPVTQTLKTTRLHLKRSKIPAPVLKLLPRSLLGANANGDSQAYILETSVVNLKEGWMTTQSKNLEWTGVLSVVEKQEYRRPPRQESFLAAAEVATAPRGLLDETEGERTEVKTIVTLHSPLGESRWKRARAAVSVDDEEEQPARLGFFRSWSTASIRKSIEIIGLKRATKSQPNAKEGMKVVLERMRQGGLVAVLEGMRRDRE